MEVRARSFRGFTIIGSGVPQDAVDRAREQVEAVLEKHGISAAEVGRLPQQMQDIGTGVDLAQFTSADWRRYGVDPKTVKTNKQIFNTLRAIRQTSAETPGSVMGFKADA